MTNISRKELPKNVWGQIFESFTKSVLAQTGISGKKFLVELFTPVERVMFAKRLAVIAFSVEEMSTYRIATLLHMSATTVLSIQKKLDRGGFGHIRAYFEKKKNREQFWNDVGTILRLGMPPYAGRGRNRWLKQLDKRISKKKGN